jgi:hypothetical protein
MIENIGSKFLKRLVLKNVINKFVLDIDNLPIIEHIELVNNEMICFVIIGSNKTFTKLHTLIINDNLINVSSLDFGSVLKLQRLSLNNTESSVGFISSDDEKFIDSRMGIDLNIFSINKSEIS